jgi:hypothetical protein
MKRRSLLVWAALAACGTDKDVGTGSVTKSEVKSDATSAPRPESKPRPKQDKAEAPSRPADISTGNVKPPSTGNEMPHAVSMSADDARALVRDLAKKSCKDSVDTLMVAMPIAYPEITKDAVPAYKTLQECALQTSRWRAGIQASVALLQMGPDDRSAAQIVRSLAEMGQYDDALRVAEEIVKRFPSTRDALIGAVSYTYCKAENWAKCQATSEAALTYFAKHKTSADSIMINRVLRDIAWVVTGKPKDAVKDFDAIAKANKGQLPPFISTIRGEALRTADRGFHLEIVPTKQLAIGVYHLMGKQETGALITIKLHEHLNKKRSFRVDVEVPGVTERASNSIELDPKAAAIRYINPPLKMDFEPGKVRGPRPSQLVLKVVEQDPKGDKTIVDETIPIEVLPRDYLPLRRKLGADADVPTFGFVGAWLTSNDKAIDEFLAKAKLRAPGKNFVGEQDATMPQIRALYDELKAKGVTYVMDPSVTSEQAFVQRTRLPADVLASTNAQCLEGTLLFATLMEAIGVRPIIAIVPGHAFVGWHTVDKDGTKGEPVFVETTMIGGYSFDQAVEVATKRAVSEYKAGHFKTGVSTLIDVAEIRKQGFTAQPL